MFHFQWTIPALAYERKKDHYCCWIYHPNQKGSVSLKNVLPAFTDLSYKNLEIGNGSDATSLYNTFMEGNLEKSLEDKLWDKLSKYCERDTYALWVLLEVLKDIADKNFYTIKLNNHKGKEK